MTEENKLIAKQITFAELQEALKDWDKYEWDMSKVTPAPWQARGEGICCGLYAEPKHYLIFQDDGGTWADTVFCALARNVADIMGRRKWGIQFLKNSKKWCVLDEEGKWLWIHGNNFIGDDQFSPVMEAERHYRLHVEGK